MFKLDRHTTCLAYGTLTKSKCRLVARCAAMVDLPEPLGPYSSTESCRAWLAARRASASLPTSCSTELWAAPQYRKPRGR